MKQSYKESARAEYSKHTSKSAPQIVSLPMQARAVMVRRLQMLRGNPASAIMNLLYVTILYLAYFRSRSCLALSQPKGQSSPSSALRINPHRLRDQRDYRQCLCQDEY